MLVYQLKILDLGYYLEPVFKTKESAECYKGKYRNRNLIIKEKMLESPVEEAIYRIKNVSDDGYYLEDEVYDSLVSASKHLKNGNQEIVKEKLYCWKRK